MITLLDDLPAAEQVLAPLAIGSHGAVDVRTDAGTGRQSLFGIDLEKRVLKGSGAGNDDRTGPVRAASMPATTLPTSALLFLGALFGLGLVARGRRARAASI